MGILESRTLDFKHIILAGVNEGILPAGRRFNSLLPYDIKRNYGLPTYEEKDAVYAYHFYRIQQRCLSSTITFNTDSEAMGGGEPSRFLVQLENELQNTACIVHPRAFLQGPVAPNSMEQLFDQRDEIRCPALNHMGCPSRVAAAGRAVLPPLLRPTIGE